MYVSFRSQGNTIKVATERLGLDPDFWGGEDLPLLSILNVHLGAYAAASANLAMPPGVPESPWVPLQPPTLRWGVGRLFFAGQYDGRSVCRRGPASTWLAVNPGHSMPDPGELAAVKSFR